MKPERWKKIEALFESALDRDSAERAAFLDRECGDDESLRQEVESLLAHQQATGRFIPTLIHDAAKLLPDDRSFADSDVRFIPGLVLAERYRIIGLLGKGGMGEVYRADDLKLGQPVALKFLPESLAKDRAMLARFHQEVRIARQISHPNICRVYDIGEAQGQHFLSMEYVDGEDLGSLLRRIGRLPSDKATEIASQLCAGLAASHEQKVLHRDLKPATVMIDGRGKARIMDFGLAGLAGEFRDQEVRAGTPAYMAPEQLAGREVSVKSDIYSLGLVLYELFTGRKVFEAGSLEDLMRQHESSAPPSISDYVKEIDPLVERVISRCLEKDPRNRPASVSQVAAALPGGDPLAAALAAGETPSPEMVAAAPKEGALRPPVAVACLAGVFVLFAAILLLSDKVMLHNRAGLKKSPDALAERAGNIINRLGYTESPVDTAHGFSIDEGYGIYAQGREVPSVRWDRIDSGQPLSIFFWYRQSPRYLETLSGGKVSVTDPPMAVSNMATALLDPRGRLIQFEAVPPQIEESPGQPAAPDWSALFAEAGLDMSRFVAVDSKWVPPMAHDARAAWEGVYPDAPDVPIRVEAAVFRGRPVYFHLVPPWERPFRQEEFLSTRGRKAAGVLLTIVFIACLVGGVLIARRNLRLGRGDRKGAYKLALFVFFVEMIGLLLHQDHLPSLSGELNVWYEAATQALFLSVLFWLLYVALEPYVRRRWPNLIISWSRLMAGGFRDPMVGRDILIGGLLGFSHTLSIYFLVLLPDFLGQSMPPNTGGSANLFGVRALLAALLADSIISSILISLALMFMLLLLYVIFRKQWLATSVLWVLHYSVIFLAFGSAAASTSTAAWVTPALIATVYILGVTRFGLLCIIALQLFFTLSFHYPVTSDFSNWYAGTTIFSGLIILSLSVYGFYVSLAGQPLFRGGLLSDE
ncbi:MAG TPA: serine/threonine-protein kinase [Blastocatellia bacterium]|nr:serine/threonine-protein kinase [Blastocatellia bacterium]